MGRVILATCNLNQWALDFKGNLSRIVQSIREAKSKGAKYRLGPELEVPGYGCEDHFFEEDTYYHCWECIAELLKDDTTDGIICDIGMPVIHSSVRYNCRIFLLNRKILFIRPKVYMADDGNYREPRWFSGWRHLFDIEEYYLPRLIRSITGQHKVPFGVGAIATVDTVLSSECCEELFTPNSPHIYLGLSGVEIIGNGSGSHHQLRKLDKRIDLIKNATAKSGGIYLYANQQGCDGGRLYFDGCAMIVVNGQILAQGSQFSLHDVEVVTAVVDLRDVRSYRGAITSRGVQASESKKVPRIDVDFVLSSPVSITPSPKIDAKFLLPEEEIAYGPACWLWDYLRRSGMQGFFLPLSGGADSSSTAAIVGIMCRLVEQDAKKGIQQVIRDARRIIGEDEEKSEYIPTAQDFCSKIFFTCYMGTVNSSEETKNRAAAVAKEIGSTHLSLTIDEIVKSYSEVFKQVTDKVPKFKVFGGSLTENLALQNIQARSRMVLSYFLSQLLLWTRGKPGGLLVLSSANVDEALRGYFTKYDASSADINPIGSISKVDLKKFLVWAAGHFNCPSLKSVVEATPTAELEPITKDYVQSDEADMGMTYQELSVFGRLRKLDQCGPVSMYEKLVDEWTHLSPQEIAEKVKRFFKYYSINRHKMTTLTPSYHAENYSPDDNRYDLRPFLYNTSWTWQFEKLDERVKQDIASRKEQNKT